MGTGSPASMTRPRLAAPSVGLPHAFMVLAGLVTFVLVSSALRDRSATIEVWMVGTDVPAGVSLDGDELVPVAIAAEDPLLPSLLATAEGVPVGLVRHGLVSGEPLLASDLVPVEQTATGRTVTIPVDSVVLDGLGLARGDRLDLIGVDAAGAMHYVVTDVEVVRLPGAASPTAFAAARSREAWVTIRVDDQQALRLSEVVARGSLDLVRSTGAAEIPAGRGSENSSGVDTGVGS